MSLATQWAWCVLKMWLLHVCVYVYYVGGSLPVLHEWILWRLQPSAVECVYLGSWAGPTARHHYTAWRNVPAPGYSLLSHAPCSCDNPGTKIINITQLVIKDSGTPHEKPVKKMRMSSRFSVLVMLNVSITSTWMDAWKNVFSKHYQLYLND